MKKSLLPFLAILFISILSSNNVFSQGFNSVTSPDGIFVVAVGNQGLVFRSSNGGTNWETYNVGTLSLNSVTSFGNNFWIAAGNGRVYKGDKTVPGSLTPYTVDAATSLNGIHFVSATLGYTCTSNGKVYKSTNGGTTWVLFANGITAGTQLNGIHFLDNVTGAVVANGGVVYLTFDGGNVWGSAVTGTTKNLLKVKYFTGAVAAVGADGTLITKTGAGNFTPVITRTVEDIRGVSGSAITDIHVCGGGGFIRNNKNTTPSFLNFETNPMVGNLQDICYFDANVGYAVSSLNRAIIKTTNGGTSWALTGGATASYSLTVTTTGLGFSGNGIGNGFAYHPTNKDVIYICHGNEVFRSGNRGLNWTQIATVSSGTDCHSFYVSPLDTNLMIASLNSSSGRVMRTTNYGQTWTQTWGPGSLTSYGMPLEMDQNNPNVLYLAPDNAVIMKSTNFGLNWTNHGTTTFRSPCDIAVQHYNSNIVYVGDGVTGSGRGKLWKSTNGGVSWDSVHSVSGSEIPMIAITKLDTNLAYHTAWSSGGVWKSTNRFGSVSQSTNTGSAWACDVALDDPTAFSFCTYSGTGYLSVNGASSYSNLGTLPSVNAGMAYISKGDLLLQSGSGVSRLNVTYNVSATPVVVTGVEGTIASNVPDSYNLYQNYPNPFNPSTTIRYDLPEADEVKLRIYDQSGKEIATLVNGRIEAGSYEVVFDASHLSSGIYFYRFESGSASFTKKMTLIK